MKTITFFIATLLLTPSFFVSAQTARYFDGPTVSNITTNSAKVSLSEIVLGQFNTDEQKGIYFEYYEEQTAFNHAFDWLNVRSGKHGASLCSRAV